ncbi:MAG: trypsin-like serine protease [Sandaracinaceae bacterium]|nr:trypsin-like serine protease [Sandaracinaceae bacterium]
MAVRVGPPSLFLSLCVAACSGGAGGGDPDGSITFDAGALASPDGGGSAVPDDMCGDVRNTRLVYNGTAEPTAMPLTQGQVYAVVSWNGCSGSFIADEWVLTATHCGIRPGRQACVGVEPARANVCFTATEVYDHPSGYDITLVHVDAPASSRLPQLEPIPIMTEVIDDSWIGRIAEAAGYGQQEDGSINEREFTAEPIDGYEQDRSGGQQVRINGMGERGVCFGDSGGPLMVLASDSTVRVVGVLSWGDPNCLGRDRYTRSDVVADWIEGYVGPTVVEGAPCGRITPEGDCTGGTPVWCEGDTLTSERCTDGTTCGWDASANGFRCVADDPCGGVTPEGECDGNAAVWCDRGTLRRRDCGACGETCFNDADVGGYYCGADPCDGIDYLGECQGDTAVWCSDGEINSRDCGSMGLRCDYVNDRIGYFCTR